MKASSRSAADEQILAQQQLLQAKVKRNVFIAAGLITFFLVLYLINQALNSPVEDGQKPENSALEVSQLTTAQLEQYRDTFKANLAKFEASLQAILDNPAIAKWQSETVESLRQLKDKALSDYARSSFRMASETLDDLSQQVRALEQSWQQAYQQALAQSSQFLEQQKINQARLSYAQAIVINPLNPDGTRLKQQLDAYEKLADLRQALSIADRENNRQKQITLLTQLLSLDPSATQEQALLVALKQAQSDQNHAQFIQQGNKALDRSQLNEASLALAKARALKAQDPATKALASRLALQQKNSQLQNDLNQIEALVQSQAWSKALEEATTYVQRHPAQERFAQIQSQAQAILTTQSRVQQFITRPARLADESLRQAAIETLQNALPMAADSSQLATDLGRLASAIDNYNAALDVVIASDQKSYITVVGVGHVGRVEEKQIQLTPGSYTLEARREGYRTKRLDINVIADKDNRYYLACDEAI